MAYRNTKLQLGPISAAVGVNSALDGEDAGLMTVCLHGQEQGGPQGPTRIRQKLYCETCGCEDKDTFQKAKEVGAAVVLVDADALKELISAEEAAKSITMTVHPAADLTQAMPSGKSYYLSPQKGAENDYALMVRLVAETPELAYVGEYAFSAKGPAWLFQIILIDGVLALRQLARPDLVRARPVVGGVANEDWLEMAKLLATQKLVTAYDPLNYSSKRAEALARLVQDATPVALASAQAASPAGGQDMGAQLAAALAELAKPAAGVKAPRRRAAKKAAPAA